MREYVGAQIGDDALAQGSDQVVAQRAGDREHRDDADHHREIAVDQLHGLVGEAEIDHPANRHRHDQRGERGDDQCGQCGECAAPVADDVGHQPSKRFKLQLAPLPGRRRAGNIEAPSIARKTHATPLPPPPHP